MLAALLILLNPETSKSKLTDHVDEVKNETDATIN